MYYLNKLKKLKFKKNKIPKLSAVLPIKKELKLNEGIPKEKLDLKKLFGIEIIQKIDYLYTLKSKISNKELIKELSKLVKYFFGKYFNIRYQFTVDELKYELDRVKIKNKDQIISLLEYFSEVEYNSIEPNIKIIEELNQKSKNIIGDLTNLTPIKVKEIKPSQPIKYKEHYITPHIKEPKIVQQKEFEENFHKQVSSIYKHIQDKDYDQALTHYNQLHKKKI